MTTEIFDSLERRVAESGLEVRFPMQVPSKPAYLLELARLRPMWQQAPPQLLTCLLDPVLFWMFMGTFEGEPIEFDTWQSYWLRDHSRLRAVEKAPQIGWSWVCALEALHEALMFTDSTSGFVSVDQREASEKILYARKAYHELPQQIKDWIPMPRDSQDELNFGDPGRPSRIMSIPATSALRGRKMSVYLDEVDFYKDGGRDSFRVAMGRITRGGRVSMGSTCFGVDTELDRLMQGEDRNFSRGKLPWVVAEKDHVLDAVRMAREEMDPEDAAEEYDCIRGGSTSDTFPAELIRRQTSELMQAITLDEWTQNGPAVAGYDAGKTRHPSILTILEQVGTNQYRQIVLEQVKAELPQQHQFLNDMMRLHKDLKLVFDATGIGAYIGQAMKQDFGNRVIPMVVGSKPPDLPPQTRSEMVIELKRGLESNELELVPDREMALQFRRTRRRPNGDVEQPGSAKKTHYDRFWSTAYAWYGTRAGRGVTSVYNTKELLIMSGATATPHRF